MWLEGRVYIEYLRLIRDPVYRGVEVPPGLGRPVLLIPGFLAGDWTLRTPFQWLRRVGYNPQMGGVAFNVMYSEMMLRPLINALQHLKRRTGARVALIGHSRGGVLAKVLSHRNPELVEQVITSVEKRFLRDLAAPPRVPTSSLYSRTDGVVNWRACLRPDVNAIEVNGSHIGLALNPEVYRILAQLLTAPWRTQ